MRKKTCMLHVNQQVNFADDNYDVDCKRDDNSYSDRDSDDDDYISSSA